VTAAFLCDGVRTPIGGYGGALSGIRTDDLGAIPLQAAARRVLTAPRQLQRTGGRRALVTMCIGVGQGIALAIEAVRA
jgi:acetyl-CoA acetyltransferase